MSVIIQKKRTRPTTQHEMAIQNLGYALTWIREARESKFEELRKQHLDEAERLIVQARSNLGVDDGQTQAR